MDTLTDVPGFKATEPQTPKKPSLHFSVIAVKGSRVLVNKQELFKHTCFHVCRSGDESNIALTELGAKGRIQEEGEKRIEDAGTQKDHVPGVDEPDHTEVRSSVEPLLVHSLWSLYLLQ